MSTPNNPLSVSDVPKSVDKKVDEIVSFEELMAEYTQVPVLEELATLVRSSFDEASNHRSSTNAERDILRAMRSWNSEYDPDDLAALAIEPGNDIFLPITNLKCRALRSWLHDILVNAEDKPWALTPTPDPELPPEAIEAVVDALQAEIEDNGYNIDLRERASYYKDLARKHVDRLTSRAVKRIEERINDTMLEGGWRTVFASFMADVSVFPTAFIKGPVVQRENVLTWKKGKLRRVSRQRLRLARVHPLDIFPSPSSSSMQDGAYIIERVRLRYDQLHDMARMPGYNTEAVQSVLAAHNTGVEEELPADDELEAAENRGDADDMAPPSQQFDTLAYYGRVPASLLIPYGVELSDPTEYVEAEVWTCNNVVIRAILNPHPLGLRPFYATSFETIPGSVWGRSLPQILRDTQRVANASARSLVRNMAFASGPIGEVDTDRLDADEPVDQFEPYRIYHTRTEAYQATNRNAFNFHTVPSVAKELMLVQERFSKIADDVSGIPSYVVGSPQVAGAGRTLGGLSLLMGNAAKGIKLVISNIDRDVIEPIVTNFYTLHMLFDEDPSMKADASVLARGAAGLLQKELMQARAIEVLTMLTPYASSGVVPAVGLQNVIRDVLRGLGYNADEIVPDPERKAQIATLAQQIGRASTQRIGLPPPRQPRISKTLPEFAQGRGLDRRSAPPTPPEQADKIPALDALAA